MSFLAIKHRASPPRARTLLDIFNATAVRCGERLAVDADDGALTYTELSAAAGELAERLRALGVGPGDRVGIQLASGTSNLYVAILGALSAGAPGATLGPAAAMLPDTAVGSGCTVGGRSVVMRGEQLPAHTRWQGIPVVAA